MARKTKYKSEYCDMLIEYFESHLDMRRDPRGDEIETERLRKIGSSEAYEKIAEIDKSKPPSALPTLYKFARLHGLHFNTLTNWARKYPKFAEAFEYCKELEDEIIKERGLLGIYDSRMSLGVLKLHDEKAQRKEEVAIGSGGIEFRMVLTDAENACVIKDATEDGGNADA